MFRYEDIENEIKGYKYVVGFSVSIDDPLDTSNQEMLFMCDTRDECIEEIKKHIEYQESSVGPEITHEPYNITRIDCYIKWTDGEKFWWWSYGIYPVKYVTSKNKDTSA